MNPEQLSDALAQLSVSRNIPIETQAAARAIRRAMSDDTSTHCSRLDDLTEDESADLWAEARRQIRRLDDEEGPEGYSVG